MRKIEHLSDGTKICRLCGPKQVSAFGADSNTWDGLRAVCKNCRHKEYDDNEAAYKDKNHESYKRRRSNGVWQRRRLQNFGITEEIYARMLDEQHNACKVCGTTAPGGRGDWHIDHDRKCCSGDRSCGKCVRGLLCHLCNVALGCVHDSPEILKNLLIYLEARNG